MAATTAPVFEMRSTLASSRIAFGALLLRDLVVLRKRLREFIPRTLVQPFLLCFVFLYVFPTIGTGVGGARGPAGESAFATVLVAGVVGLSIMFQGIQAVALPLVQEFGFTREIEDRVLAPLPVEFVAIEKVVFGALQGGHEQRELVVPLPASPLHRREQLFTQQRLVGNDEAAFHRNLLRASLCA